VGSNPLTPSIYAHVCTQDIFECVCLSASTLKWQSLLPNCIKLEHGSATHAVNGVRRRSRWRGTRCTRFVRIPQMEIAWLCIFKFLKMLYVVCLHLLMSQNSVFQLIFIQCSLKSSNSFHGPFFQHDQHNEWGRFYQLKMSSSKNHQHFFISLLTWFNRPIYHMTPRV
jgi:hypothetical protein